MDDRKIPPIKYEDLHKYLRLIKRCGFGPVHFTLISLMHFKPTAICDFRQSLEESSDEYEEPPCVCEEIPDVDVDPPHILNSPWDLRDCLSQSHIDTLNEPLPNLGDPDEESHDDDDDEHFDPEASDRFMSEPDYPRFG